MTTQEEFHGDDVPCADDQCQEQAIFLVGDSARCLEHLPYESPEELGKLLRMVASGLLTQEADLAELREAFISLGKHNLAHCNLIVELRREVAALRGEEPDAETEPSATPGPGEH